MEEEIKPMVVFALSADLVLYREEHNLRQQREAHPCLGNEDE